MVKKLSLKKDAVSIKKSEYVESVQKSLKTPIVPLKYCYLAKPFFYPGSHIPRYSITLLFDKTKDEQRAFLEVLEGIATKSEVETLGYIDQGLISIKFQTKDSPKIFSLEHGKKKAKPISLEHDLPEGFKACVEFELNTYFNKATGKKGFNFCPKRVTFHLDDETTQQVEEVEENGDNKSSRNRPRIKDNGIRDSKLSPGKKRSVGKQLRSDKNPRKAKGS